MFIVGAEGDSREDILSRCDRFLSWKQACGPNGCGSCTNGADVPLFRILSLVSEHCETILAAAEFLPLVPSIRGLFAQYGIDEFDANTMAASIAQFFAATDKAEEALGVDCALYDGATFTPPIAGPYSVPVLNTGFTDLCALATVSAADHRIPCHPIMLATPVPGTSDTSLRITVHDAQLRAPAPNWEYPVSLEIGLRLCQSPYEYLISLDAPALIGSVADREELALVLYGALLATRRDQGNPVLEAVFEIGPNLLPSIHASGAGTLAASQLLRSFSETVDGLNLGATHAIRIGAGPESAQVTRDGAKAWRRDIDHEFHLHYWMTPRGYAEFADVVRHNDMGITS